VAAYTLAGLDATRLVGLVDTAGAAGRWVSGAGPDVGERGEQTVLVDSLEALCRRAGDDDVWVAPVGEVARCLSGVQRSPR
jgi:hypothetical protein